MKVSDEETLPNGIRVYREVLAFGESLWYASASGCCGRASGFTRDFAIEQAMNGCEHCGVDPLTQEAK